MFLYLEEEDLKEDVEKKLANLIGQSMKAQKDESMKKIKIDRFQMVLLLIIIAYSIYVAIKIRRLFT